MIIGKPPFETKDVKTTYWKIQNTTYEYPEEAPISVEAKHLIDSILTYSPRDRLKLSQIKEHPWISKCGFIPKSLPVEWYKKIISPQDLQSLEKSPNESTHEEIKAMYFEERDSKDYEINDDYKNQDDLDSVIDLDSIVKVPATDRIKENNHQTIFDSLDKQNPLKLSPKQSRSSNHRSPMRQRILTFRKHSEPKLIRPSTNKKLNKHRRGSQDICTKHHKAKYNNTLHQRRAPYITKWVDYTK